MDDLLAAIQPHGLLQASQEGCWSFGERTEAVGTTAVMIRRPRLHVLSQYNFCVEYKHIWLEHILPQADPLPDDVTTWLIEWSKLQMTGWHGNFTPRSYFEGDSVGSIHIQQRIGALSSPPFSPWENTPLDINTQWPELDGGGTLEHSAFFPYHCFSPINLQTQRLTCEMPMVYPQMQDLGLAVKNMQSTWFVGIVERYQESICLLHVKLGDTLPEYCDCTDPDKWNAFPGAENNVHEHDTILDESQADLIDQLTSLDLKLYEAAWARFVGELQEVQQQYGVRVLCNETLEIP